MILLFFLIPLLFTIPAIFAYQLFEKAGEKGGKLFVPFYNLYVWLKLVDKHNIWWYVFIAIPFINVFVFMLMIVELLKCYGKNGILDQAVAVIFPFIYLPYLGMQKDARFLDTEERKFKKTAVREWFDAIIFAVIAASIIRIFLFEAYSIPTSSMEKSLLVGDFLFVSKIAYGPRAPMTPIAFPFVHHTMPLSRTAKSYLEWIKLPYFRFPGLSKIKRNDAVVFNFPDGDTLSVKYQSNHSYHAMVREFGRETVLNNPTNFGKIISRPLDKRENFIKRCVGMPGDNLEIRDQKIYIDGVETDSPGILQFVYKVYTDGSSFNPKALERIGITENINQNRMGEFFLTLTEEAAKKLATFGNVKEIVPLIQAKGEFDKNLFPFDTTYKWNIDNYGPILIPEEGKTVALSMKNISLYKRIISAFEGNTLKIENDKIIINDKEAKTYTFKQNYYWLMGDNRHNSADSRYWGFVPEDHVVGKASFVWFSLDKNKPLFGGKIRWDKLFRVVK